MSDPTPPRPETDAPDDAEQRLSRMTRRAFLTGGGAALLGFGAWEWIRTRPNEAGVRWPLRNGLRFDENLSRAAFRDGKLAPTFAKDRVRPLKVNGNVGLGGSVDPSTWMMTVVGLAGASAPRTFSLADIQALPRVEMTTELKCIEGWSVVVTWAGARLSDFVARYGPQTDTAYVGLKTPDARYYVGLDHDSAMHPQTLLCYEMNGAPLTGPHGAPLRLVTPTKYGIKHLKRIGTLTFTNDRPADYWAERGYDWYAGH